MTDWTTTRAAMAADRARLAAMLGRPPRLHTGLLALRMYRIGHWLHGRGHKALARLLWALNLLLTGADLDCAETIGAGCVMPNPRGVVVYGAVGPDCTLGRQFGIGGLLRGAAPPPGGRGPRPQLGARCVLGDRALVLGSALIGDDCKIDDDCVVLTDLPAGSEIEVRSAAWRTMRMDLQRRPRPDPAGVKGLAAVIRTDVARSVMENSGSDARIGFLRFWGHLILPALQGLVLFRLAHALHSHGWWRAAILLTRINSAVYGLLIHPASQIGPGAFIPHTIGVRFCGRAGPLLSLFPQSSVGPQAWPELGADLPDDVPLLGTDVGVGAQAEVVGGVRLGDLVLVGVKAHVARDIADGLTAVPRPNWRQRPRPDASADREAGNVAGMQP
jgi:serine O-acetyltransferase